MAKTGNALRLSGAGNSDEMTLADAPAGNLFNAIKLKVSMTVTAAAAVAYTTAELVAVLQRAIGNLIVEHGPKNARQVAYSSIDGSDLRTLYRFIARNEIPNSMIGATPGVGANTVTATVALPFVIPWLRGQRKRPGTAQVRTFKVKVVEGSAAISANLTRTAGTFITITVEYDSVPSRTQTLAPILSLARENSPRRDATGPDGLPVLTYVPGTAHAASPLTTFKLDVGGQRVHEILDSVQSIGAMFADDQIDQGAAGITDSVTVLQYASSNEEIEKLPHGKVRFEEDKPDLSPIDLRVLYYPPLDESYAKRAAAQLASDLGKPVVLTQEAPAKDDDNGAAAVRAATVLTPDDAAFALSPGLLGTPGSDAVAVSVPPHYVTRASAAASAVKAQGSHVAKDAASRLEKITSLRIPGATGTDGSGTGGIREEVRARFASAR